MFYIVSKKKTTLFLSFLANSNLIFLLWRTDHVYMTFMIKLDFIVLVAFFFLTPSKTRFPYMEREKNQGGNTSRH